MSPSRAPFSIEVPQQGASLQMGSPWSPLDQALSAKFLLLKIRRSSQVGEAPKAGTVSVVFSKQLSGGCNVWQARGCQHSSERASSLPQGLVGFLTPPWVVSIVG
ncbi:hypothetical protein Salat_1861700 [Sesamum alatum]|uniref:Uncharacterized protein n=1 Tax=Sesamum alatum TaxID=300844 RepID=A0AAE2CHY2_9LAMI|nr:hypothetical protein Salat_1861700 [Sesamum alatum]